MAITRINSGELNSNATIFKLNVAATNSSIRIGDSLIDGTIFIGGTAQSGGSVVLGNSNSTGLFKIAAGQGGHTVEIANDDTTLKIVKIATNAALANDIRIGGATSDIKIGGGSTGKIGFFSNTSIVRPTTASAAATFVANTSGIVNDTATFDGYTIGKVVKALRDLGLLA